VSVTILALGIGGTCLAADRAADLFCGPPAPEEVYPVAFAKLPADVIRASWQGQAGYRTDLVRGSLTLLAATGGDFTVATEACVMDDSSGQTFEDPAIPPPGEGYWYLLRVDQYDGCPMGEGTYNSRKGHQAGDRNVEIQTSGRDCACFYEGQSSTSCTVLNP
jgi:hypothetical protein